MKTYLKLLSMAVVICLTVSYQGIAQTEKQMKVTFINPAKDETFWKMVVSVMKAAADDLHINLEEIAVHRDHIKVMKIAEEVIQRKNPPDYLIIANEKAVAGDIIEQASAAGVKTMLIVNGLLPEQVAKLGLPREKYPLWIGTMIPDNISAGVTAGQILLKKALAAGVRAKDGKLHAAGIAGAYATPASLDRVKGFEQAVKKFPDVSLKQIFPNSEWSKERAAEIAKGILDRYPETAAIWAANDNMALGAMDVFGSAKKIPGKDCFFSGVNWDPVGLQAVKDGKLSVSVGGHFLIGGWALVLLYDHYHGKDFNDSGVHIEQPMSVITDKNVDAYLDKFKNQQWEQIDFRAFSKTLNPNMTKYDFGLNAILGHQ